MFLKNCNFRIIQATNFVSQLQRECSESVNNEPLDVMWVRDLPSVNAVNYDYLQFCVSVKSDPFTRLTFVPQPYAPSPLATRIYENAFLMRSEKPIHKKHYTKSLAISLPHDVDSRCPGENFTKLYFNTEIVLIFNVCSRRTEKKADDKTLCCFLPRRETIAKANIFRQRGEEEEEPVWAGDGVKTFSSKVHSGKNLFKAFFIATTRGWVGDVVRLSVDW